MKFVNTIKTTTVTLGLLLLSSVALAQGAAAQAPQGFDLAKAIVEAAKGGKWGLFASLVIMLLVWAATKTPLLKKWLKGPAKIWVAAVAGVLTAFATNVFVSAQAGSIDWFAAASSGLSVGLAAGGLWSLVGRKILKQPIDADGDGVLDPESTFQDDPEPEDSE